MARPLLHYDDRMSGATADRPDVSALAAAIGEPARAKMLAALMDGRALTATELSLEAGVTPSTASSHLGQLERAGLVAVAAQGRHRYFRIAGAEIAALLEQLMGVAAATSPRCGPRDPLLRYARVCYDHLAGGRAVQLLVRLQARGLVRDLDGTLVLGGDGEAWLARLGIDAGELRRTRRPLLRACLDWSERRDHLAGAVAAALLGRLLELRLVERAPAGRALAISPRGERFLETLELP